MPYLAAAVALVLPSALPAAAAEVVLEPSKDNTLYADAEGDLSNGAGQFLFTGFGNDAKRALLAFDLEAAIPAGATIESVELTLFMTRSIVPGVINEVYRVVRDWGEGASDASGQEGAGGAAQPGDASWLHTFFATEMWEDPGGDFVATPSASQLIGGSLGAYTFGSTPELVADVQGFVDDPSSNFGWIIRGPESFLLRSAKRFGSREEPDAERRPRLRVVFSQPAVEIPAASGLGLAAVIGLLIAAGLWRLGCRR